MSLFAAWQSSVTQIFFPDWFHFLSVITKLLMYVPGSLTSNGALNNVVADHVVEFFL